ncbi:response regulator [Salinarimonas sp.]|uniref:response regulator n=1 Tax=Salinarimonas sp. TaxID=2766526 RepID=UPI003919C775
MRIAFERLSVIVAEDDPFWRRLVAAWLEAFGARRVRLAADGAEALAMARSEPPDLVITDWEMPRLDGVALARALRDRDRSPCPFVPIVMLSSTGERARVVHALKAGLNAYLVKPVTAQALYERLLAALADTRPFVETPVYFGPDRTKPFAPQIDPPLADDREA